MVSVFPQSALDWWPKIDAVYCHSVELRNMFGETLHKAVQGCGAHPAIRMAPVRLIMNFEFHPLEIAFFQCLYPVLAVLIILENQIRLFNNNCGMSNTAVLLQC
jgi:hypothetical protein